MDTAKVWRPGGTLAQNLCRLRILFQHVVGSTQDAFGHGSVERIKPHIGFEDVNRPPRISCIYQGSAEAPVHVVWVERDCSFKLRYRCLVAALPLEDRSQARMGNR